MFQNFYTFTATKSLLTRLCCQKGRCIFIHRGSTHFVFQTTSFDDNGITGPDWGRSELVFDHVPVKTLAPQNGVSLCHIHCDLLVSSTLCFCVRCFSAPDSFRLYHPMRGCQDLHGRKFIFRRFLSCCLQSNFFFCFFRHFQQGKLVKDAVNIRDSTDIAQRFRALDNRSFALLL